MKIHINIDMFIDQEYDNKRYSSYKLTNILYTTQSQC